MTDNGAVIQFVLYVSGATLAVLAIAFLIASPEWYEHWRDGMWRKFRLTVRACFYGKTETLIQRVHRTNPSMAASWEQQLALIRGLEEPEGYEEPSILTTSHVPGQDSSRFD